MTVGFVFWLLMLLWLIFGMFWFWPMSRPDWWTPIGFYGFIFVLFCLVGYKLFGFPIHG